MKKGKKDDDPRNHVPKHNVSPEDFYEDPTVRTGSLTFYPIGDVDPQNHITYKFRWENWDVPGRDGNVVNCELVKGDPAKHSEFIDHQYGEEEPNYVISAVFSMWHIYHGRVCGYGRQSVLVPLPLSKADAPGLGGNPKSEFGDKSTEVEALVTV